MKATLLLPADAPREVWLAERHKGIGASDIAAVLGISPWQSPFSLHWQKVHGWEDPDDDHMEAGRRMEPMIAEWWADRFGTVENLVIRPGGLYRSTERPWQLATPDRLVHLACGDCGGRGYVNGHMCQDCYSSGLGSPPVAVLECKHPYDWDGFGEPGTNEIPVYYLAQVQQQCDVLGVHEWWLAAYAGHEFRVYRGYRDDADVRVLRHRGAAAWAAIERREPPDVDEHPATVDTLKRLHPSIEDRDVQVGVAFAEGYRRARAARARAAALVDRYEARARLLLGTARRLMCGKQLVVSRSIYERGGEEYDLHALDEGYPTVDRLNPGRATTYLRSR